MVRLSILLGSLLFSFSSFAQTSYLCIADKSTGFSFNKTTGEWNPTVFKTTNKYLISKSTSKDMAWDVKNVGESVADTFCEKDFNDMGVLRCLGMKTFYINRKNGRYIASSPLGYWLDNKDLIFKLPKEMQLEAQAQTRAAHQNRCLRIA